MTVSVSQSGPMEQLYRENFNRLYMYAKTQLRVDGLAQEAVQETFRIACEKADDVFASPNPQGWLMRTLQNVIRNMKRSQIRAGYLVAMITDKAADGDYITYDEPDIDVLYGDIAERDDYQLLKRIAVDRSSMVELAEERGISIEACKKRVQRAKKTLRKKFEKYQK